jgi:DNA (cytosine-5)-methyltransferase 1
MTLRHLDLFSGIGGFARAAQDIEGIETTQFVEIDCACQKRLKKHYSRVPIHADITTFNPKPEFELVTAGYPCQDISPASHTKTGIAGNRSGLFFEVVRIIRSVQPKYLILENSSALLTHRGGRDMGVILRELSKCGYDAQWSTISACAVGAPHMRNRLFILAYPNSLNVQRLAFQRALPLLLLPGRHVLARPTIWS